MSRQDDAVPVDIGRVARLEALREDAEPRAVLHRALPRHHEVAAVVHRDRRNDLIAPGEPIDLELDGLRHAARIEAPLEDCPGPARSGPGRSR